MATRKTPSGGSNRNPGNKRSPGKAQSPAQKRRSTPGPERLNAAMRVSGAGPDSSATGKVLDRWSSRRAPSGRSRTR